MAGDGRRQQEATGSSRKAAESGRKAARSGRRQQGAQRSPAEPRGGSCPGRALGGSWAVVSGLGRAALPGRRGRFEAGSPAGWRGSPASSASWTGALRGECGRAGRGEERPRPSSRVTVSPSPHSLRDVSLSSELHTLNAHCNLIATIQGLDHLRKLQHLDLSSNRIRRMEGLDSLAELRTLSLSCNLLTKVEGLQCLFLPV